MAITPERFIELLEEAGYETRSYSGRGMYGEPCVAVSRVSPASLVVDVLELDISSEERHDLRAVIENYREDALGLGNIIYWRSMRYPDEKA